MNELKVLELFGGIGACTKALERLNIPHVVVDYVEIDKYAVKSFNAIHNTNFEPQDICEWNKDIEVDLLSHGSPCQDFSAAGKQAGGDIGSGTRSSLMYETIRIVGKLRPKYVIWENVKNLLSKKHRHNFDAYLKTMESLGYKNYYQVLNAKDYGIPQNRERVFTVSILGNSEYEFPPKQELKLKLKDMLDDEVDEKYYLSEKMINYIVADNEKWTGNNHESLINKTIASTINTAEGQRRCDASNYISNQFGENFDLKSRCVRLKSLIEKTNFEEGKVLNMDLYNQTTNENISQCITEPHHNTQRLFDGLRIRKITPKEAWRLMGFDDEDFERAKWYSKEETEKILGTQYPKNKSKKIFSKDGQLERMSNTQLYKQAGNSIVVDVLMAIFKNLFI